MGHRAAVVGASGYAGGELLRLLLGHPDVEPVVVAAGSQAGADVAEVHPHLPELSGTRFVAADPVDLAAADVVFLALPHGASAELVPAIRAAGAPRIVDLGADFRLHRADDWSRWYGTAHPLPEELRDWPYGLPELPGARDTLAGAHQVAVPGCYPTAVALALTPLLVERVVDPTDLVVVAASGASGAGRAPAAALVAAQVMGDLSAYKVARHQHTPEIVQTLRRAAAADVTLSFTTVLAPMPRGILATCTARLAAGASPADVAAALGTAYADEAFVHVLSGSHWPHTAATAGSNACQLRAAVDVDVGRVVVVAALDNLGKGAAGQAVQCANLMLGLSETAGLSARGVAP